MLIRARATVLSHPHATQVYDPQNKSLRTGIIINDHPSVDKETEIERG